MPLIQMKKIWTPLDLVRIEFYYSEDKEWYVKKRKKALKKVKWLSRRK